ncbi:MAG: hypothetical protein M3Q98_01765 [Actinomycetota bacterium]|nr:hypothetical protein [Actinomycetota bacterium]
MPQNSFVGRVGDLETVRALLERERWVTIVGPAGSGKTRLALEVAAADDRVPVVAELEHSKPGAVVSVLAKAIGLGVDSSADPEAACAMALASRPYLLVIDNCDRVTGAVGEVVGRLLSLAGSLTVLATSRSPIGGPNETVHQLLPLAVDRGEATGAVQLFLDRARTAAPTAEISAEDRVLVAGICKRLDGLPLAIELAAARMRHLSLGELAARLEEGFGPLDNAGAPSRHRTLKTAFEWTWDLLDRDEQSVMCHLAALPLTFDVGLAEAVSAPGAGGVVFRLLDRSLVSPTVKVSDPRRFRLLDSLREFVLERTEPTIVEDVLRTHALHHATLAGELTKRSRTDDSKEAADMANRLCPEMNAAIRWAISGEHQLALALARALSVGCEQYGADPDSLKAIARAARDPKVRSVATPADLLAIGIALCYDDLDLVAELAEIALDIADDDQSELAARHLAGYADAYRQRGKSALVHFDIAERLVDELLDMWQLASVRQGRGLALRGTELNDPEGAIAAFESAMHTFALAGDAMHVNNSRYMMAATAAQSGLDTKRATLWAEQCAAYARDSGNRHELAHAVLTRSALSAGPDVDADIAEGQARWTL